MNTDLVKPELPKRRGYLFYATVVLMILSVVFGAAALLLYLRVTPVPYGVLKRLVGRLTEGRLPTTLFILWPLLTLVCGILLRRVEGQDRVGPSRGVRLPARL